MTVRQTLALFKKKPKEDDAALHGQGADAGGESTPFQPEPKKAQSWFNHARTAADTYNYEYALHCYACGIQFDPEPLDPHKAMYQAAAQYANKGGKPASGKERKQVAVTETNITPMAVSEFEWMKDLRNLDLAMKAIEGAAKSDLQEVGRWMAQHCVQLLRGAKKLRKSTLVKLIDLCESVNAWNEALVIGQAAVNLDPTDNDLASRLKDLSAQRAMDQGGYEKAAGNEGGFRDMIKDEEAQRELSEVDAIATSEDVEARNLQRAEEEYEANPSNANAITKYAQLLRQGGSVEQLDTAYKILIKGHEQTGEYRFRMSAGDIRLATLRGDERAAKEALAADAENEQLQEAHQNARAARLALQGDEYRERVSNYPTNIAMKFELANVEFGLGNFDDAMAQFQKCRDEPKLRTQARHMLGKCFAESDWHLEAIAEYRDAIKGIDPGDKGRALDINYDLMVSLIAQAKVDEDKEMARDALEICSTIAREDITYRDIRDRRREIDTLIKSMNS